MIIPVSTFGQETLSSSAATSSRSANAVDQRRRPRSRVKPMTLTISGTGSCGELRQVVREVALEALVGQPDRVDHAAGELPQPRRRVALARLERDGLGDEGGEREAREQRVAERAPRGDRVERAGGVDDRVRRARGPQNDSVTSCHRAPARRRRAPGRRRTAARSRCASATTQPKHAPKPHAIPDSSASWAGTPALRAQRAHRLEHRRRPAGVDRRTRGVELLPEQFGDEPVVADRAVVGRDARVAAAAPRPRRARRRGTRAARGRRRSVSCQIASGAIPTPPPTSSGRAPVLRRGGSRRPAARAATARRRRAARTAARVPGPTSSNRKSSRPSSWRRSTENARGRNGRLSARRPSARSR